MPNSPTGTIVLVATAGRFHSSCPREIHEQNQRPGAHRRGNRALAAGPTDSLKQRWSQRERRLHRPAKKEAAHERRSQTPHLACAKEAMGSAQARGEVESSLTDGFASEYPGLRQMGAEITFCKSPDILVPPHGRSRPYFDARQQKFYPQKRPEAQTDCSQFERVLYESLDVGCRSRLRIGRAQP